MFQIFVAGGSGFVLMHGVDFASMVMSKTLSVSGVIELALGILCSICLSISQFHFYIRFPG